MADAHERGLRQKAFRQRQKEKHQAEERRLKELADKVATLEHERDQLQRAVDSASSGPQGMEPGGSSSPGPPDNNRAAVSFCFGEATVQLHLTEREVEGLTLDAMADIWKRLVQRMALSLGKVDEAQMDSPFQAKLEGVVHEAISFMWALVDYNPRMTGAITTCNMEGPNAAQSSSGNPRDWPAILVRMQLSEGQAEQLMACRRTMLHELDKLIAGWDQLWADLQAHRDMEERPEGVVNEYAQLARVTERLRSNVHAQLICRAYYISYAYTRVLSSVQIARYLVAAYPMGPDMLSLMTYLTHQVDAQQANEPSTGDALDMARPETAAATGAAPGAPICSAGDWRPALVQPLRVLHGRP